MFGSVTWRIECHSLWLYGSMGLGRGSMGLGRIKCFVLNCREDWVFCSEGGLGVLCCGVILLLCLECLVYKCAVTHS